MKEQIAINILCGLVFSGAEEVRHDYIVDVGPHFIKVDCENADYVIEMGLDKRTSFDSVHQAMFASIITGKKPMIVIIDTDLRERKDEFQIRTVAEELGVRYMSIYIDDIPKMEQQIRQQIESSKRNK